jgi:hypothetical protein
MAVSAWLSSKVASELNILGQDAGLRSLPPDAIAFIAPTGLQTNQKQTLA